jgi:hypothetical protein
MSAAMGERYMSMGRVRIESLPGASKQSILANLFVAAE